MRYGRFKKAVSGFLAAMTIMTTVLSPLSAYAAEVPPEEPKPPLYEEVKDQLDVDEVVKAEDLELEYGCNFDVKTDFSNIEIPDNEKVKVTFEEAKNESGEEFTTQKADSYKAVYYVQPLKTEHPKYQISRKLIVKEAPQTEQETETPTEATPHLHIDFVPFTTGSKRGLDTRVSLKQALAAQGFKGGTRGDTE